MSLIRRAALALRALVRKPAVERELDAEVRFHLEMETANNERLGLTPAEARRRAVLDFGGVERFKEAARDARGTRALEELAQDLRHAVRRLVREPGFSGPAVATLALGLGATTVIFSVVDHVVLRPLAYADAGRLVVAREVIEEMRHVYPTFPANAGHFLEWRRGCSSCEALAAVRPMGLTLTGAGDPQRVGAVRVSANLFSLLRARPAIGRTFAEEEDQPGRDRVVVLSDAFWRRQFGADRTVVGRAITLDDVPYVVVGVMPRGFRFPKGHELGDMVSLPRQVDVFKPLALTAREEATPGEYDYAVLARLRPGVGVAAARAELDAIEAAIAERSPNKVTLRAAVTPLDRVVVGTTGRPLVLLLAAVLTVLLIVCVNLANLWLARSAARSREAAVRIALGASRGRLVRHALAESLVVALVGGAAGVLLAVWGLRALLATAPATLPRVEDIRLDGRVIAVSLGLAVAAGLAFGTVPALRLRHANPADALRSGSRSVTADRRGRRARDLFIAAQAGLSTVLLVATGLFLASFVRVLRVDKGFAVERVLAIDVVLPRARYGAADVRAAFYEQALHRLAAVPGVSSAAAASALPLEGETQVDMLSLEHDTRPEMERPTANIRYVSPDYFATVGTPVRRGRPIGEADRGRHVVVLSERAARALWPGEDPIGKLAVPGSNDPVSEVVGVASDVRTSSLEREGSLVAYVPYWGRLPGSGTILLRTASEPGALAAAAREALRQIDPTVPVTAVRTMSQVVSAAVAARRFQLALLALFGLTALATASVGIYGVIAHSLARRTSEIGVRMALGARPTDIHRLVLREGLTPVAAGLGAGVVISVALSRAFRSLLFEVTPGDPLTLAGVAALLGMVAAVACYVPARRATGIGVVEALRLE